jgi:hypothetical protein
MMPRYTIDFTERVSYRVTVEAADPAEVLERWEMIYEEGDFHPIDDFLSCEDRELGAITNEATGAIYSSPEALEEEECVADPALELEMFRRVNR